MVTLRRRWLIVWIGMGTLLISVMGITFAQEAAKKTKSLPESLENYSGEWRDAIAELEEKEVIASGGTLIFEEDYAYFSGRGSFATPLGRRSPHQDIIMADELQYEIGGTEEAETCSLMARIVVERNQIQQGLEVGITNERGLYYADVYGSGRNDYFADFAPLRLDLDDPHHILFIAKRRDADGVFGRRPDF